MKEAESVNNNPKSIEEEPENKRQEPAVPEEPKVNKYLILKFGDRPG